MALYDLDGSVQISAVKVVAAIGKLGHLDEEDQEKILPLLFSADSNSYYNNNSNYSTSISSSASNHNEIFGEAVGMVWKDEFLSEVEGHPTNSPEEKTQREFKAFAEMILHTGTLLSAIEEKNQEIEISKNGGKEGLGNRENGNTDEDDYDEDDLRSGGGDSQLRVRTRMELKEFLMKEMDNNSTNDTVGYGSVKSAVHIMWSQFPALKDYSLLSKFLCLDFSNEDISVRISDEEEAILVYVLGASIEKLFDVSSVPKKTKPEDYFINLRNDISRVFAEVLPKLIAKYKTEFINVNRLREIVRMIRVMNVGIYIDLRILKVKKFINGSNFIIKCFHCH